MAVVRTAQIDAECNAVRSRVALVDQSSGGKLYLLGPDAERAAKWLFSAHIPADAGARVLHSSNTDLQSLTGCLYCTHIEPELMF